jgi:hypothetical protein
MINTRREMRMLEDSIVMWGKLQQAVARDGKSVTEGVEPIRS